MNDTTKPNISTAPIKGNPLRTTIVIIGFALIFNYFFNIQSMLYGFGLLPSELYQYPQNRFNGYELLAFKLILSWVIPIIISTIFVLKVQIHKRLTINYGFILIATAVAILIVRLIILYLTTLIPGGGATFVTAYFFSFLAIPIKIMLVVGAIKLLTTLKPVEQL